jgi:hypothetical protein
MLVTLTLTQAEEFPLSLDQQVCYCIEASDDAVECDKKKWHLWGSLEEPALPLSHSGIQGARPIVRLL